MRHSTLGVKTLDKFPLLFSVFLYLLLDVNFYKGYRNKYCDLLIISGFTGSRPLSELFR